MQAYLENIKNKPESTRKQILVISLVISMIIVGFIWFYGLTDRLTASSAKSTQVAKAADDSNEEGPFQLLKDSISNTYHNISASVGSISFSGKAEVKTGGEKQIDLRVVDPNK